MATQDIVYEPIDAESKDIRLLRLYDRSVQGLPTSEIFHDRRTEGGPVCEIFHASLDDNIQYEALSYAWGDTQLQRTILVNGSPTSVTINLARALEDVRLDLGTRVLWVDALCIDQQNTEERNHQVKQMGAIYQKAEKVVVWLGRPNESREASILDSWDDMISMGLQYSAYQPDRRSKWLKMASLCELPYWRRLWIVQEVGLASEIWLYHGRSCQTWKQFSNIRKAVHEFHSSEMLHGSLRGIATTISDGLPGRLDQQREYRQPAFLKDMDDAIHHLLSRAEDAAKASWISHEVFDKLNSRRQLVALETFPSFAFGPHAPNPTSYPSKGIGFAYCRAAKLAAQMQDTYSEEELELLPDEQVESPLVMKYEAQVTIHPFLPLDQNVAEALRSLPRHIKHFRKHEREQYQKNLNEKRDNIHNLLPVPWENTFTGSKPGRKLAHLGLLSQDGSNSQRQIFDQEHTPPINSPIDSVNLERWNRRSSQDYIIKMPLHLDLEYRRLAKQIDQANRTSKLSREESEHDNDGAHKKVLQLETRSEQIRKLKMKIKYMNDRYREVENYFKAWRALHESLKMFSPNLELEIQNHQPSFLLRTLLETCERSLCQNPRDKVYGLLGLASNIEEDDLQVDYSKPMFDLFWDVVWLTYRQESSLTVGVAAAGSFETELVRFSQLVQRSLGGPFPTGELLDEREKNTETDSRPVVYFPGFVIGPILSLDFGDGISASALYKNRVDILKQYFEGQRSRALLTGMATSVLDQLKDANEYLLAPIPGINAWGTKKVRENYESSQRNTSRQTGKSRTSNSVLFLENSGLIGLAPYNIRSDDLLVQFSKCDIAAIIRPSPDNEDEYTVVGRAVVARRLDEQRKRVSNSSQELFKYSVPDPQSLLVDKMVWLELDAASLQWLTCPVSAAREYNFDVLSGWDSLLSA